MACDVIAVPSNNSLWKYKLLELMNFIEEKFERKRCPSGNSSHFLFNRAI